MTQAQVNHSEIAPAVYEYVNYQAFLRDVFHHKRQKSPNFSLSAFSRKNQVLSKTYLSMILHGKRKLPAKGAGLMASALGLNQRERKYFESLVHFNHARTNREKEIFLSQLVDCRPAEHRANLSELGYGVLYSWHCLVILELVKLPGFKFDAGWISSRLKERLSVGEANYALRVLRETKLISVSAKGKAKVSEVTLRSHDELKSLAIQKYHSACLALGDRALKEIGLDDREFSSVNVLLSEEGFRAAKEKIKQFREEILALASGPARDSHSVCQLNIQLFNLEH